MLGFVPQTPLARLPGNPSNVVAPQPTQFKVFDTNTKRIELYTQGGNMSRRCIINRYLFNRLCATIVQRLNQRK
jgi:hypothetical protein